MREITVTWLSKAQAERDMAATADTLTVVCKAALSPLPGSRGL